MIKKYWMAPDSYVCTLQNQALIYDVRGNQVYGLEGSQSNALAGHVIGWPVMALVDATTEQTKIDKLLAVLMSKGVLTDDSARGKSAEPVSVPAVDMHLTVPTKTPIRLRHWILFAAAYAETKYLLRSVKMCGAFARAAQRKRRLEPIVTDRKHAIALAEIFRRMQGYTYSTRNQCLFDSLALFNFLTYHQCYARLVVGVDPDSRRIHMWVQLDRTVLGAPPSSVCEYIPVYAN